MRGDLTAVYNFLMGGMEWDAVLSSLLSGDRMQGKVDIGNREW